MPVVHFYLVEGRQSDEAIQSLLKDAGEVYMDVFYPDHMPRPVERLRAFATLIKPAHFLSADEFVDNGGAYAPFFTFLALEGRPSEQFAEIISRFTALLAKYTGCDRDLVRGQGIPVNPAHWGIGGLTAADARRAEIAARPLPPAT